jgi:hypothetical protein
MRYLFAIALVALSGCGTTLQSTPPTFAGCVTWDRQAGQAGLTSVSVLSPELAKVIGVRQVGMARSPTGNASTYATVYNCTDVDVVVLVRTRFTGTSGQSEPPSAWKTVHLAPRGQTSYGEAAVSAASQFLAIDIYDANRGQSQFAPGQVYKN